METFLGSIAERIYQNHKEELASIVVVFPNRRAAVFFQRELAPLVESPTLAPACLTFEEFLTSLTDRTLSDELPVLFQLYKAYQKTIDAEETFAHFLTWGSTLLGDIQDIEESNADPIRFFRAVDATKKMELWNPEGEEPTALQKRFFSFWEQFGDFYRVFSQQLQQRGISTRSAIEKQLASNPKEAIENSRFYQQHKHFYLCGFNALTEAEKIIFKWFDGSGKGTLLWDLDSLYYDDPIHEAGLGPRKALHYIQPKSLEKVGTYFQAIPKSITIHGCPGSLSQTHYLQQVLRHEAGEKLGERSAIVLCDQTLAIPVLAAIPETVQHINLSLGYPIKNTPAFGFWKTLFQLVLPLFQTGHQRLNHHLFLKLLQSEWVGRLAKVNDREAIIETILTQNLLFLDEEDLTLLEEKNSDIFLQELLAFVKQVLRHPKSPLSLVSLQERISTQIEAHEKRFSSLEKEVHLTLSGAFHVIEKQLEDLAIPKNIENWKALFEYTIANKDVPLLGEPLQGLQVLGLLETRNLDFDNLYFLSVNEGTIPSPKSYDSLIPYDLKLQFNFPTYDQNDGIFAYNFYRLLQRAKNVHLFYNSLSEGFVKGEKSRFINQLIHHPLLSDYVKEELIHTAPVLQQQTQLVSILKTEKNQEELLQFLTQRGVSPSALNTLKRNPLEFYLRYLKKVYEDDALEDEVEASTFGDIVHQLLEDLYEPHLNKALDKDQLKFQLKEVPARCEALFKQKFGLTKPLTGKNFLMKNVVDQLVIDMVSLDLENPQSITILGLEQSFVSTLPVNGYNIKLKGIIDRVDRVGSTIRILDYKTGKVESKDLKVDSVSEVFQSADYPKPLQLMVYAYLFYTNQKESKEEVFTAEIISAKNLKEKSMALQVTGNRKVDHNILSEIERELITTFERLLPLSAKFAEEKDPTYAPFYEL